MRKQLLLLGTLAFIFLASCQKQDTNQVTPQAEPAKTLKSGVDDPCYEESYTIYGGQTIEVGTLTVSNDEENIFVTYDLSGTDWHLYETHVFVGSFEDMPLNKPGNPKIGNFPYSESHNGEQVYTYTFSREDFDECFTVAAHAVVKKLDENGNQIDEQTAWADGGTEFPGKRWGWYLAEYCSIECPDVVCNVAKSYGWPDYTTCFTDYGFSEFGWTFGPISEELRDGACLYSSLMACPTSCEPDGMQLGAVRIKDIGDGNLQIFFSDVKYGYRITETYVHIGNEPFPIVNGNYSINPQDFTLKHLNLDLRSGLGNLDEFIIPNPSGDVYMIAYAVFEEL